MNKVFLLGRLGFDPEVRYTSAGQCVANLKVATSEKYKDKEKTEWHRVIFFGKQAEAIEKYLKKGNQIALEGSIQYREYEKGGNKVFATEIIGDKFEFVGDRKAAKEEPKTQEQATNEFSVDEIPF